MPLAGVRPIAATRELLSRCQPAWTRRARSRLTRASMLPPVLGPQPPRPPHGPTRSRPLRGMLMTPWLAAGAGVVLAAALALHSPHAELTYTPAEPGGPCASALCHATQDPNSDPGGITPNGSGEPRAALHHGHKAIPTVTPHPGGGSRAGHGRPPLRVRYRTTASGPGGFTAVITLSGQLVRGSWQLSFQYPGARILSVTGAVWTVHGATVTVTGNGALDPAGTAVKLRLRASGTPSRPQACSFDGVACTIG